MLGRTLERTQGHACACIQASDYDLWTSGEEDTAFSPEEWHDVKDTTCEHLHEPISWPEAREGSVAKEMETKCSARVNSTAFEGNYATSRSPQPIWPGVPDGRLCNCGMQADALGLGSKADAEEVGALRLELELGIKECQRTSRELPLLAYPEVSRGWLRDEPGPSDT